MDRILGLDLGTNSIGWCVIERDEHIINLLYRGAHVFQEGLRKCKTGYESRAAERTKYRARRVLYFRRRLRKIETLFVLSANNLCPKVAYDVLKEWKLKDFYQDSLQFREWLKTDDSIDKNPYRCRFESINRKLDLNDINDRYLLGRAFYHLSQRRGFLSNRLANTKESEDGVVKGGILDLTSEIEREHCQTLGEYFYKCYNKKKIRGKYTSRIEHYIKEFRLICQRQELEPDLILSLEKAIFYQRPLKSQKNLVGKCTFEKTKPRCPISHPRYEYYRMLCFLNNIKIKTPSDDRFRFLNANERNQIIPLFYKSTSKGVGVESFSFEQIAKKIARKDSYAYEKDPQGKPYLFNYKMNTTVQGCPVSASLKYIFGDNWQIEILNRYTLRKNKTQLEVINDIWHALFSFDSKEYLRGFAMDRLLLDDAQASKFADISLKKDYASLSLKAINKIIPFLEEGLIYSHAVFLANMGAVLPSDIWQDATNRQIITQGVIDEVNDYNVKCGKTLQYNIINFLRDNFDVKSNIYDKLYHPSMIDTYKQSENGFLGSPRTSSVRNPMAMRALFQLRRLVNRLLAEGKIAPSTIIHIEMSRQLNDSNMREAIDKWQKEQEKANADARKAIIEDSPIAEPSDNEILKYRLWKEQGNKCVYTGKQINMCDFLGAHPKYDIEHTIPRSIGGDDSAMNKTLADAEFNRKEKGAKLPTQLSIIDSVYEHIVGWKAKIEDLERKVSSSKRKSFADKESKDKEIVSRNLLKLELAYWRGKYERFTMTDYKRGFKNSQGVDAGIISKYARLYLNSLFPKVYTVKGFVTAEFRKLWGLQQTSSKDRSTHIHHCIDAIVVACVSNIEYNQLLAYYKQYEQYNWYRNVPKPTFVKPWDTFTEDVISIGKDLLVSHYTPDNLGKNTKKRRKVKGKVMEGEYSQGDSVRGVLNQDSFYGAIDCNGSTKFVIRRELSSLKESEYKSVLDSIVDPVVKGKVNDAVEKLGFKAAMESPIWMNEDKRIPIKKVRCFVKSTNPICLKEHRDKSKHIYKQNYYVAHGGLYLFAL